MPASRRVPMLLGVLALLLAGLAVVAAVAAGGATDDAARLRTESDQLTAKAGDVTAGVDLANTALTDTAATTALDAELRTILERVLSYDYRDLGSTARAVEENLTGPAVCMYNVLFGEVIRVAVDQRATLTSEVRDIGVTRLDGDRANALVFVDQTGTRADTSQTSAGGAQLLVTAERHENHWKISQFDLLAQPLPNAAPAPRC